MKRSTAPGYFAAVVVAAAICSSPAPLAWGQSGPLSIAPGAGGVFGQVESTETSSATDKWNDQHSIFRSRSFAISWLKLLALWLLLLVWIRSADWINRDSQIFGFGYAKWNAIFFFPFVLLTLFLAFPILFGIPHFIAALSVLSVLYLSTFIPYVVIRNKVVEPHQRVFTPDWFRYELALMLNKVGVTMSPEQKAHYEKGAPVDLMASGGENEQQDQANLITARQSPGYILVKELIADMIDRRSDRVLFDYTKDAVVERLMIDGVWDSGASRDRESGDVMLAVMKTLANLDMNERRKRQSGRFAAKYAGSSYLCPVVTEGVKTGERVELSLLGGKAQDLRTYEQLGMREKMQQQWAEIMGLDSGFVVISSLPEGGVTTLTDVSLMETDRLLRDFVAIEDAQHRERDIENIEVTTYDSAQGESPVTILPKLIRKYPNVYVLRDLADVDAARLLFDQIRDDRLLITTVRAHDAPEALLRMLQKNVPQRDFAALVTAVLNCRLVRKLCDECKVSYPPSAELLKKLGIPPGKVEALFRPPKPEERDKPCQKCGAIGYRGRTGLFELLVVNDEIRSILAKQPKLEVLRKAARAAGMRTLQEEGILLVARGITSLQELQRVLKQ